MIAGIAAAAASSFTVLLMISQPAFSSFKICATVYVEQVLDEVVFLSRGQIALHDSCEAIREQQGKSVDQLFREVFKWWEN